MDPAFRAIPIFRRVKLTDRKSPMFANVYRRCFVHRKLSREANSPAEISITRFHDNTSHPATFPFTNSTRRHSLFLALPSPSDPDIVTSVYCQLDHAPPPFRFHSIPQQHSDRTFLRAPTKKKKGKEGKKKRKEYYSLRLTGSILRVGRKYNAVIINCFQVTLVFLTRLKFYPSLAQLQWE